MGGHVRLEVDDGVGVIRLDRPPANAFDLAMGLELQEIVREAGSNDEVGAIVIHGGPKLFAAGADIKAMVDWGPEEVRPSVDALGGACDLVEEIGKVVIAAITGFALGGGLELALACDLRYLAEDGTVGQPEIKIGVIPGAGGTQRLVRLIGPAGTRDLVYTGRQLDASQAKALGPGRSRAPGRGRAGHRRGRRPSVRERSTAGARRGEGGDPGRRGNAWRRGHPDRTGAVRAALRLARPAGGHARVPREARTAFRLLTQGRHPPGHLEE